MFTYQVRPRLFKLDGNEPLTFPGEGRVCFHFLPLQTFGKEAGNGRTAVQHAAVSMFFNANTGAHSIKSEPSLAPLDVLIKEPTRDVRLDGNVLSVSQHFGSNAELTGLINSLYFVVPLLLAAEFADPPFISLVNGCIGSVAFRWELRDWNAKFEITNQETQEQRVVDSWSRLDLLAVPKRRRLLAALHYFHVALRLSRRGETAGEFLSEVILNLAKALESLFPPAGNGKTRDAARAGLSTIGFSDREMEANYLPAMALRNEIDVGHVDLSLFSIDQLAVVHSYVERAERAFRLLFRRIFERIESGTFDVEAHEPLAAKGEAIKIIKRLRTYAIETSQ
jgi:hypothetical protein